MKKLLFLAAVLITGLNLSAQIVQLAPAQLPTVIDGSTFSFKRVIRNAGSTPAALTIVGREDSANILSDSAVLASVRTAAYAAGTDPEERRLAAVLFELHHYQKSVKFQNCWNIFNSPSSDVRAFSTKYSPLGGKLSLYNKQCGDYVVSAFVDISLALGEPDTNFRIVSLDGHTCGEFRYYQRWVFADFDPGQPGSMFQNPASPNGLASYQDLVDNPGLIDHPYLAMNICGGDSIFLVDPDLVAYSGLLNKKSELSPRHDVFDGRTSERVAEYRSRTASPRSLVGYNDFADSAKAEGLTNTIVLPPGAFLKYQWQNLEPAKKWFLVDTTDMVNLSAYESIGAMATSCQCDLLQDSLPSVAAVLSPILGETQQEVEDLFLQSTGSVPIGFLGCNIPYLLETMGVITFPRVSLVIPPHADTAEVSAPLMVEKIEAPGGVEIGGRGVTSADWYNSLYRETSTGGPVPVDSELNYLNSVRVYPSLDTAVVTLVYNPYYMPFIEGGEVFKGNNDSIVSSIGEDTLTTGYVYSSVGPDGGEKTFSVYPNPAKAGQWITLAGVDGVGVQVFDLLGRAVPFERRGDKIALPSPGIFLVKCSNNRVQKVIIY